MVKNRLLKLIFFLKYKYNIWGVFRFFKRDFLSFWLMYSCYLDKYYSNIKYFFEIKKKDKVSKLSFNEIMISKKSQKWLFKVYSKTKITICSYNYSEYYLSKVKGSFIYLECNPCIRIVDYELIRK